jgi:hypothetical protein
MGPPPGEEKHYTSIDNFVAEQQESTRKAYESVRKHLRRAAEVRKRRYDAKVRPAKFTVGEWTWYYYPRRYTGRSPKWTRIYTGPYLVVRIIPPSTAVIQRSPRAKKIVVHFDKLKHCFGPTPESWIKEKSMKPSEPEAESTAATEEKLPEDDVVDQSANTEQFDMEQRNESELPTESDPVIPGEAKPPDEKQSDINANDDRTHGEPPVSDNSAVSIIPSIPIQEAGVLDGVNRRPKRTVKRPKYLHDYRRIRREMISAKQKSTRTRLKASNVTSSHHDVKSITFDYSNGPRPPDNIVASESDVKCRVLTCDAIFACV